MKEDQIQELENALVQGSSHYFSEVCVGGLSLYWLDKDFELAPIPAEAIFS